MTVKRAAPIRVLRECAAGVVLAASLAAACAQEPPSADFRHLYTFGSKLGIHPPRVLNTKPANTTLGAGEHPYGLAFPSAVTTDRRRSVWITDSGTASVHVFGPAGVGYREIRHAGEYPLQSPSGITTDAADRVYLADAGTGAVFVFDEKGEYDRAMIKPGSHVLERPASMALSADGRTLFVLDPPKRVVVALNREGEVNGTISLPDEFRDSVAISVINNQVYILGGQANGQAYKVAGFSPAGLPRDPLTWDGVRSPSAFAFDRVRRWFLVANPRWGTIQLFDEEGRNFGAFGKRGSAVDEMQKVDSLYVDSQGLVYVVDSRQGKVLVFADSGQP